MQQHSPPRSYHHYQRFTTGSNQAHTTTNHHHHLNPPSSPIIVAQAQSTIVSPSRTDSQSPPEASTTMMVEPPMSFEHRLSPDSMTISSSSSANSGNNYSQQQQQTYQVPKSNTDCAIQLTVRGYPREQLDTCYNVAQNSYKNCEDRNSSGQPQVNNVADSPSAYLQDARRHKFFFTSDVLQLEKSRSSTKVTVQPPKLPSMSKIRFEKSENSILCSDRDQQQHQQLQQQLCAGVSAGTPRLLRKLDEKKDVVSEMRSSPDSTPSPSPSSPGTPPPSLQLQQPTPKLDLTQYASIDYSKPQFSNDTNDNHIDHNQQHHNQQHHNQQHHNQQHHNQQHHNQQHHNQQHQNQQPQCSGGGGGGAVSPVIKSPEHCQMYEVQSSSSPKNHGVKRPLYSNIDNSSPSYTINTNDIKHEYHNDNHQIDDTSLLPSTTDSKKDVFAEGYYTPSPTRGHQNVSDHFNGIKMSSADIPLNPVSSTMSVLSPISEDSIVSSPCSEASNGNLIAVIDKLIIGK